MSAFRSCQRVENQSREVVARLEDAVREYLSGSFFPPPVNVEESLHVGLKSVFRRSVLSPQKPQPLENLFSPFLNMFWLSCLVVRRPGDTLTRHTI